MAYSLLPFYARNLIIYYTMTTKKLLKSSDKMLSGVCGGLAEYFNLDPTLVRALYAIGSLLTGGFTGIIAYIILAVVIPEQ